MNYQYRASRQFWKAFHALNAGQQANAKEAFKVFKKDPFDPSLKTHKIHKLSAAYGRTIYSVTIEANLRAVFYLDGDTICTVDIGTHDIYK